MISDLTSLAAIGHLPMMRAIARQIAAEIAWLTRGGRKMRKEFLITTAAAIAVGAAPVMAETVTIATVNNGDMIVMQ